MYFGHEKPLVNLVRYQVIEKITSTASILLVNEAFSSKYSNYKNLISYKSSWTAKDKNTYYDYELCLNYFTKRNKSLNIFLINRFFGPYKIVNHKTFFNSLKYFYHSLTSIRFTIIKKAYGKDSEYLLSLLRNQKIIESNDTQIFADVLSKNGIEKVVIFSTLSDPSIFDMVKACIINKIEVVIIPDCWDNISTAYSIPKGISKIYLWSDQQIKEVEKFFSSLKLKSEKIGTYRINLEANRMILSERKKHFNKNDINILYIGGYFLENQYANFEDVVNALKEFLKIYHCHINLVIRNYPFKKQTIEHGGLKELDYFDSILHVDGVTFLQTKHLKLEEDLKTTNIIISELSTASLEAAFSCVSTLFICSSRSPKRLDTKKSMRFTYANDLKKYFNVIDLDNGFSDLFLALSNAYEELNFLFLKNNAVEKTFKELSFFAEPFDFNKWHEITT